MTNGTIKKIYEDKKFGFITGEDGKEYFFHITDVKKPFQFSELENAQHVTFDGVDSSKGPRAKSVHGV